jgi:hypothetical protein
LFKAGAIMTIIDVLQLERSKVFTVKPRQEVSVDLSLKKVPAVPDTKLTGQVIGHCLPIAEATVKVLDRNHHPIDHTITDSQGNFSFLKVLPAGDYYVIATADNYKTSMEYRISLKIGDALSVIIELKPDCFLNLGTIYGTVRDDMGNKLSDAKIIIQRYNNSSKIAAITTSNTDGEYLVYGLKPGKYWISAIKDGYSFYKRAFFDIKPKDIIVMNLFLYEIIACRNGTISGQILYKEQPVSHAIVALYRIVEDDHILIQLKEANSDGIYLFADITPGEYLIKSKHEGLEKTNSVNVN